MIMIIFNLSMKVVCATHLLVEKVGNKKSDLTHIVEDQG